MMCIACEQDAMWFAYLERKGLITPDGYPLGQAPSVFAAEPAAPAPIAAQAKEQASPETAEKSSLSDDDPAA